MGALGQLLLAFCVLFSGAISPPEELLQRNYAQVLDVKGRIKQTLLLLLHEKEKLR